MTDIEQINKVRQNMTDIEQINKLPQSIGNLIPTASVSGYFTKKNFKKTGVVFSLLIAVMVAAKILSILNSIPLMPFTLEWIGIGVVFYHGIDKVRRDTALDRLVAFAKMSGFYTQQENN